MQLTLPQQQSHVHRTKPAAPCVTRACPQLALLRTYPISTLRKPLTCIFASASSTQPATKSVSLWTGSDEFTPLNDRLDAPPLPLPPITRPISIAIVRHGQSTWNAEGRVQGSTDLSILTDKGVAQAQKAHDMLQGMAFSALFVSPLARARQTADIVWGDRIGPRTTLPALREVDLYSLQGLVKLEGKQLFGPQFSAWQKAPEQFEMDGHAPIRELWYRASLAWRQMLAAAGAAAAADGSADPTPARTGASDPAAAAAADANTAAACDAPLLVVAHNAVNQALLCTALGLPPSYFRRMVQDNAALSAFELRPGPHPSAPPSVVLTCMNKSLANPFKGAEKVASTVVLLSPPAAAGQWQDAHVRAAAAAAELLSKLQVTTVLAAPSAASSPLVTELLAAQRAANQARASVLEAAGAHGTIPVPPPALVASPDLEEPAGSRGREDAPSPAVAWRQILVAAAAERPWAGGGHSNVVVVAPEASHAALLYEALGVAVPGSDGHGGSGDGAGAAGRIRISPGGLSVLEFGSHPANERAAVRCINNTAYLERLVQAR